MKPDYKLLKPLPGIPEGTIYKYFETDELYRPTIEFPSPRFSFPEDMVEAFSNFFEKLPERIEIIYIMGENGQECLGKKSGEMFNERERMNATLALNGELYSIEQICDLFKEYMNDLGKEHDVHFNVWLKQRNK